MARRLATTSTRTVATIDGSAVRINNLAQFYYDARPLDPAGTREGGNADLTGFRLWESAPRLIRYLDQNRRLVQCRTVLELGAGTGAVGLAAATMGAKRVVLSDADSTATLDGADGWEERSRLASLADNVALNRIESVVSVAALRWGEEAHISALSSRWAAGFDTIVASDCLYSPRMYDALFTTIATLAAAEDAAIVLAYPMRHGDEAAFIERLRRDAGFELVDSRAVDGDGDEALRVAELSRRTSG